MNVRIDRAGQAVVLTLSEKHDGVNPPATITLLAHEQGKGMIALHMVGGDPEREDEDIDKPTLLQAVYNGDERTFAHADTAWD
jgi:hypothetical protein